MRRSGCADGLGVLDGDIGMSDDVLTEHEYWRIHIARMQDQADAEAAEHRLQQARGRMVSAAITLYTQVQCMGITIDALQKASEK